MGSAIADGSDYFAASGDSANGFLDAAFTPQTEVLANGVTAQAEIFDNGTPYEPFQGADDSYWVLEWNTPFDGTEANGTGAALRMEIFNPGGTLISTSSQSEYLTSSSSGFPIQQEFIEIPSGGPYYIAVVQTGSVAPTQFDLFNPGQASGAGELLDPEAGASGAQLMGQDIVPGVNNVGAVDYANTPAFSQAGDFPEYFSVGGTSTLYYDSNNNPLTPPQAGASVEFVAPDGGGTSNIPELDPFFGTSAAAPVAAGVAALMLQANPNLTTEQVTSMLAASAVPLTNTSEFEQGAGLIQAPGAVQLALNAECYAHGTRLATERGEIAIETLRVGDRLLLAEGGVAPAIWIGRRVVEWRGQRWRERARQVRILAGAFGPGRPRRDLVVSPNHALFLDGVLIPARCLVDGTRVILEEVELIEWWHVELPGHAAILAEGLPAESYLDIGNRALFGVGVGVGLARRKVADVARLWEAAACVPLVSTGARLAEARTRAIAPTPL